MKTPKLVLYIFIVVNFFILLLQFIDYRFILNGSKTEVWLPLILNVSYSVVASAIFYFVAVYLPYKKRQIEMLFRFHRLIVLIDDLVKELSRNLQVNIEDCKDFKTFDSQLKLIKSNEQVMEYENWHQYLFYFKQRLIDTNQLILLFYEYIDEKIISELTFIQTRLLAGQLTFQGYNTLLTNNLSPASLDLQEIIIHNELLQKHWEVIYEKNKEKIDQIGKVYRKINFEGK